MPHDVNLIATIAAGFGLAMVFGLAAARLRLPPLVGYLLAGVVVSPATPGYAADVGLAGQLAEIGVMLLMFGVGLHFSLDDLRAVRRIAVPGALVQIAVAALMGMATAWLWGWSPGGSLVFGLCLSVASTVVLLRALEARGLLHAGLGQIAVGWLVVEDLVMVLVLVLLPALAGAGTAFDGMAVLRAAGLTLAKIAAFVALMLLVGRRVLPRLLWWVARTGSQELFPLAVVAVAIGVAFGAALLFDVSFALGAFFAGMMMRESEFGHRAADESLPLRDAFAVLFFVSVGMLFDPPVVVAHPVKLLAVVIIIMLGKTLAAIALVLLMRYPLHTALTVGASLAQIGEFSFILAGLGRGLGLLPDHAQSLVLAGALISIAGNEAMFAAVAPLGRAMTTRFAWARRWQARVDPLAQLPQATDTAQLAGQAVIVGYGSVGARVGARLRARGLPVVVAERKREVVDALRRDGLPAVCGDASTPEVLVQAHVAKAAWLIVTFDDIVAIRAIVGTARQLRPEIGVVLRAPDAEVAALLEAEGLGQALIAEQALADAIVARVGGNVASAP